MVVLLVGELGKELRCLFSLPSLWLCFPNEMFPAVLFIMGSQLRPQLIVEPQNDSCKGFEVTWTHVYTEM